MAAVNLENVKPTPKPERLCKVCGKPAEFVEREWAATLRRLPQLADGQLGDSFFWEEVYHQECEAERMRALERKLDRERLASGIRHRRDRVRDWYARPSLPLDASLKRFKTYRCAPENQKALELVAAWQPADDFGVLLTGPAGVGKSHLGFAMLHRYMRWSIRTTDSRLPVYTSAADMIAKMRGSDNAFPRNEDSAPLLFLDDLGTENITDWSREILFRLFDGRVNRKLPTIITTNLKLSELKDRLHERVVSRILAVCIPVELKGADYRMNALTERVKVLQARARQ
jgi:DNA replication protein DnaC